MNIINMIINVITGGIKMLVIGVASIIALIFLFGLANKGDAVINLLLFVLVLLFLFAFIKGARRKK